MYNNEYRILRIEMKGKILRENKHKVLTHPSLIYRFIKIKNFLFSIILCIRGKDTPRVLRRISYTYLVNTLDSTKACLYTYNYPANYNKPEICKL